MQFTLEQQQAIFTRNCDLLVAAAAGSGKTAVLVERIIQMITDKKNPIDIDKLLVVTFTEAAASEMRQRISVAISERLLQDPYDDNLKKQSILLSKASISTIHSFCLKVIRRNFHLLDIEPNFRVADSTEIDLLKMETIEQLFEELYEEENTELFEEVFNESSNQSFLKLVEIYGSKVKDDALQKLVLEIHQFINANPMPEQWIYECVAQFDLQNKSIDETAWADIIKRDITLKLDGALHAIDTMLKQFEKSDVPDGYIDVFNNDKVLLENLLSNTKADFYTLYNSFNNISYKRMPSAKGLDEDQKKYILEYRNKNIKDVTKKIEQDIFFKDPKTIENELYYMYPAMRALGDLVLCFSKRFLEAKKDKYIVDFGDFEHYALKVLIDLEDLKKSSAIKLNPENIRVTKEALELQEQYEEILIDEYQDSNMIQELILMSVSRKSRNTPNRFMVGDIKQSIYSFRLANPDLFRSKYNSYSSEENGLERKIDLSKNFRSRKNILDAINFICKQIMTDQVGEVVYNEAAALYYGANYPDLLNSCDADVECIVIDLEKNKEDENNEDSKSDIEEFTKTELEAKIVAEKIDQLLKTGYVCENNDYRPVSCSDIVILLRSISTKSEIYINELKKYNIKAFADITKGFFDSIEVITMLAFLHVIDNPRQDIYLLSVLHSPVYDFDADELMEIRSYSKRGVFFDAVKDCVDNTQNNVLKEKLLVFFEFLDKFRNLALFMPINELLWLLYEETNYYNYVGAYAGGDIRQANLRELLKQAMTYEKTGFKGLFHFIRYVEKIYSSSNNNGIDTKTLSEADDVIRIMSIHKSKGLEFPIVFVSGLGGNFNKQDSMKSLILHQSYGLGPKYIDIEKRIQYNSIARYAISREIMRENLSEELRILYVALTRAKEKLILTGCINDIEKNMTKWTQFIDYNDIELPISYILKSSNFFDCIIPTLLRHKSLNEFWDEDYFSYNRELYNDESNFKLIFKTKSGISSVDEKKIEEVYNYTEQLKKMVEHIDIKDSDYEQIKSALEWEYKLQTDMPSKISVSEIKRMYQSEISGNTHSYMPQEQGLTFDVPEFLKETSESLTSTQKGTIFHTVIEHLDLHNHRTMQDINDLLQYLQNKNILKEHEIQTVNRKHVLDFVNSELAERIRKSPLVKKEVAFVIGISPSELFENSDEYNDELVLVHGIIDCFFEEDGKIVLVDYKTDRFKGNEDILVDRYRGQIQVYKKAIERSLNKEVKEAFLYLFATQKSVAL